MPYNKVQHTQKYMNFKEEDEQKKPEVVVNKKVDNFIMDFKNDVRHEAKDWNKKCQENCAWK